MGRKEKMSNKLIITVSVLVPVIVAVLLFMPDKIDTGSDWVGLLPHLNAVINTVTSLLLWRPFSYILYYISQYISFNCVWRYQSGWGAWN